VSNFVDLGSTSQVFNANLKFDTWVLPFLNVYALVGYVHNNSTTHARPSRACVPVGWASSAACRHSSGWGSATADFDGGYLFVLAPTHQFSASAANP
jgi:hypothetical protein